MARKRWRRHSRRHGRQAAHAGGLNTADEALVALLQRRVRGLLYHYRGRGMIRDVLGNEPGGVASIGGNLRSGERSRAIGQQRALHYADRLASSCNSCAMQATKPEALISMSSSSI